MALPAHQWLSAGLMDLGPRGPAIDCCSRFGSSCLLAPGRGQAGRGVAPLWRARGSAEEHRKWVSTNGAAVYLDGQLRAAVTRVRKEFWQQHHKSESVVRERKCMIAAWSSLEWWRRSSRQLLLGQCARGDLRPAMAWKGTQQPDADPPLAASHSQGQAGREAPSQGDCMTTSQGAAHCQDYCLPHSQAQRSLAALPQAQEHAEAPWAMPTVCASHMQISTCAWKHQVVVAGMRAVLDSVSRPRSLTGRSC